MSTSPPRDRKPINPWLLIAGVSFAVLVVTVSGLFLAAWLTRGHLGPNDRRLPDGSILRVEKVTWGNISEFEFVYTDKGTPWWMFWERQRQMLKNHCSGGGGEEALVIWLTRRDGESGRPLSFDEWNGKREIGQAVEASGNPISSLSTLSWEFKFDGNGSDLVAGELSDTETEPTGHRQIDRWAISQEFPPFRTRDGRFEFQIKNSSGKTLASWELMHPSPPVGPTWPPDPLPTTKTDGDLSVTLHHMKWQDSEYNGFQYVPEFTVNWKGQRSDQWRLRHRNLVGIVRDEELTDPLGNQWSGTNAGFSRMGGHDLDGCPGLTERAWKLRFQLVRKLDAGFSASETWPLGNFAIPEKEVVALGKDTRVVNGTEVTFFGIGGAADVKFLSQLDRWGKVSGFHESHVFGDIPYSIRVHVNGHQISANADTPKTLFQLKRLSDNQHFDLLARDDFGRDVPVEIVDVDDCGFHVAFLKPEPDATSLTLTAVVQTAHAFEFFVPPPKPHIQKPTQESTGEQ